MQRPNGAVARVTSGWLEWRRSLVVKDALRACIPALVAVGLFMLAIGGAGRNPESLALVQTVTFLTIAAAAWTGILRKGPISFLMLGMVLAVALTSIWSIRPDSSVRILLLWILYVAMLHLVTSSLTGSTAANRFADALIVVAGALCLVGLYLFLTGEEVGARWSSTFYTPNPFAGFLLPVTWITLARVVHGRTTRLAFDYGAATVLLATAFVLTYSRGAWLALAVSALPAPFILRPPSWRAAVRRVAVVGVLTAVVVVLLGRAPGTVVGRAASISDASSFSAQDRLSFWRSALAIFRDHSIVGTGPGTFAFAHTAYQTRYYARDAHNIYVQTAAEMGIVGVVAFGALLFAVGTLMIRTLRRARHTEEYPLIIGTCLGLIAFLLHSAVEMDWAFPVNPAIVFALLGILAWYDGTAGGPTEQPRRSPGTTWRLVIAAAMLLSIVVVQTLQIAERRFLAGYRLLQVGRWAEATTRFRAAAQFNPINPAYLSGWALAATQSGQTQDDPVALVRRASDLDRMNAYYRFQLAEMLHARKESDPQVQAEVVALMRQGLDLDPFFYPEGYLRLALILEESNQRDEAERVFRQAIGTYAGRRVGSDLVLRTLLLPRVRKTYSEWAGHLAGTNRPAQAVEVLQALLNEDSTWAPAYLEIASLYERQRVHQKARQTLLLGLASLPDDSPLLMRLWARAGRPMAYPG